MKEREEGETDGRNPLKRRKPFITYYQADGVESRWPSNSLFFMTFLKY
jgi:hypothetical protein